MNAFQQGQHGNKFKSFCEGVWQLFVLSLLAFSLLFYAAEVDAAQISFEPSEITVKVAPGDIVSVPVAVSLQDTALPNSYASFGLAHAGGSLNRSWINNQVYVSLNSWYKTRQVVLRVRIPENAEGGVYTGHLKTVWLRSNEGVAPTQLKINVDVDGFVGCSQVPLFSDIAASESSILARNKKQVGVDFSGSIAMTEGCEISSAEYQLVDEYGELDRTEEVTVNADGSFAVSVPMLASRKGNDKDGRLYTVKFSAENEAGVGESVETNVVVEHDNSKK